MSKINIFVCENFSTEFQSIVKNEMFDDVIIKPYSCICENMKNKNENSKLLKEVPDDDDIIIICSKNCEIVKMPDLKKAKIYTSNYCFAHLANEQFIQYIIQKGRYIIGSGWLSHWKDHINNAGFTQEIAKCFYQEFCKELVYFDAGIDLEANKNLIELSEFLQIPFVIIPCEIEFIELFIKSIVYECRLHNNNQSHKMNISELQSQCAEYSAILDVIGKISAYTNKHDTIEKIKEIFIMVLGVQQFNYYNIDETMNSRCDLLLSNLLSSSDKVYVISKEENRFCIKIQYNNKIYGIIDVSNFLFPQYITKYLNFAIEVAQISGLVLSNIEQYEKLIKSERELQYISYHDSLTGLYNRAYINEMNNLPKFEMPLAIFIFDIDMLKYVNDNFGHLEGDKLIQQVAIILKSCLRDTDTLARIGGDEFVAILPKCNIQMAETIRARIHEAITINNDNIKLNHMKISLSDGYAISMSEDAAIESLMHKADALMYENKAQKRR